MKKSFKIVNKIYIIKKYNLTFYELFNIKLFLLKKNCTKNNYQLLYSPYIAVKLVMRSLKNR